ncbi:MAG: calcium/sodium antiporter [Pseudomonadales bacterium]|nr:calcium/sodium antiporter [Pseudomonadales bacterium]MBL4743886.1 calcium/sodium antiporter [Cycloclasticus sp.]
MSTWLAVFAIFAGFVVLAKSADAFVDGAAACAGNFGMSPAMVGLTVVSIGTSAPEILVSIMATLDGAPELAVGNALGSNIANTGMVLGITALIAPIPVRDWVVRRELPILFMITVGAGLTLADLILDPIDGALLLLGLAAVIYILVSEQGKEKAFLEEVLEEETKENVIDLPQISTTHGVRLLVIGLVLLLISSKILVWGATSIAVTLGISEAVIGLTIVAIGTSLPELAATISCALKGHHDIALGNIIGSNIFNMVAVLPIPALLGPMALDSAFLFRDFGFMLLLTVLLMAFAFGYPMKMSGGVISRQKGVVLLLAYVAFNAILYITEV